jgi:hypothetical protein
VKIIYQPFRCRRDSKIITDGFGEYSIDSYKFATVFLEAREEPTSAARVRRYGVLGGQLRRILLQSLNAK